MWSKILIAVLPKIFEMILDAIIDLSKDSKSPITEAEAFKIKSQKEAIIQQVKKGSRKPR
jgi:hypothetical protein